MTSMRSGVIIVGAGLMGHWHAHAANALGEQVRAVVDLDIEKARSLAKQYRAKAASDVPSVLDTDPLAVHVCTPPDSHVASATLAIGAGAHVLLEKPFAPTLADARTIFATAAKAQRHAVPVHQYLFQTGTREAIDAIGSLGPLAHADFVACSAGAEATGAHNAIALDILPHALSVLRRLAGPSFASIQWNVVAPAPGELRVTAVSAKTSVSILISTSGRPTRNTARFIGERGTVHLDFFHGFATFESPEVSRGRKIARPFTLGAKTFANAATNLAVRTIRREPAYPGLRELVGAFYAAARTGTAPPITADETLDVVAAAERIASQLGT